MAADDVDGLAQGDLLLLSVGLHQHERNAHSPSFRVPASVALGRHRNRYPYHRPLTQNTAISLLYQRPRTHAGSVLATLPIDQNAASLYIHVPFCFHKCHYCDFYSLVDTRDRQDLFVTRLCRELKALVPWAARPLRTI